IMLEIWDKNRGYGKSLEPCSSFGAYKDPAKFPPQGNHIECRHILLLSIIAQMLCHTGMMLVSD
ncbi:MAG: hypothetical protein H7829_19095, partial [Magnetococcus sp. THC-1_WYH]